MVENYLDSIIHFRRFRSRELNICDSIDNSSKTQKEFKDEVTCEENIALKVLKQSLRIDGKETFYEIFLEKGIEYAKKGEITKASLMFYNAIRDKYQLNRPYKQRKLVNITTLDGRIVEAINMTIEKFIY